jgi:hypothetical protein
MTEWGCRFTNEAVRDLEHLPPRERAAVMNVIGKLSALGPSLAFPHVSAVLGAPALFELRPRAGRSRHRPLFIKAGNEFVILVIAKDGKSNRRSFNNSVRQAMAFKSTLDKIKGEADGKK